MATTAYPHGNVLSANLSLNQPNLNRPSEAPGLQGLLFAAIGVSLGLLAGTATAVGAWSMNTAPMSQESVEVRISAPVVESPVPAPVLVAQDIAPTQPAVVSATHHSASNSFAKNVLRSTHTVAHTASADASTVAPVAVEMAVTGEPAASETVSKPAQMTTEGDLTVADFDASTGTLATREGRTFTVSAAGSGAGSQDWQDYSGNVHYQCTQTGNCSLTGSGVASNATML
jgi:hypothetical protein